MTDKKIRAGLFSLLLIFSNLFAEESFRVRKLHSLKLLEDTQQETSCTIGINDSIAIFLPDDQTFIEGIEVRVQIPQAISAWRDSVACSIYEDIRPTPESGQIDYTGKKLYLTPLPSKLSWIIKIPLREDNTIKDNQYSQKLHFIPQTQNGFTFLRFQPVMKGVPEETLNATLTVSAKPILINKGRLNISLSGLKSDQKYELYIDDEPVQSLQNIILSSGMHNINIQSEDFRNEVRSVYIEQAKTTDLNIKLKSITPSLIIISPGNADVYLDNERCSSLGKEIQISEGEHKIRFVMGSYEIIRTLTVLKGKTYTANLSIDLQITEE